MSQQDPSSCSEPWHSKFRLPQRLLWFKGVRCFRGARVGGIQNDIPELRPTRVWHFYIISSLNQPHFPCWLLQTVYLEATTYMAPFFQTCKIIRALCFKPSRIIHRPGKTSFSFKSFHCDSAWILATSFTHISNWHLPNSDEMTLKYGEDQQNNKIVFPYLVFKNTIVWYIHRTPIHIHLQTLQLPPPPPAPCIQDPWHRLQLHLPQSCHVQFGLAWRDSWMFSFKDLGNDGKISRYLYL